MSFFLPVVCAGESYYHGGELHVSCACRSKGFGLGCALVFNPAAAEASDGSSSTNFSRSVLDGYRPVVVLVSLTASSNVRSLLTSQHHLGLLESSCGGGQGNCVQDGLRVNAAAAAVVVRVGRCSEALDKLFSADDADWVGSWDNAGGY
ncbi:hypothetical protein F2Q68_00028614 [Brassica cretica]|uniref:Uncharacterized protein n=2 Tax=Brassica cretica TaxID=69181 RepID=A0A8S9GIT2_BRACR|nr:hypothetical protein F2Q68_00028614 [Brassica cretica]KAF3529614.1 hypothetical protein DY000_02036261 [Brassica cretica]